jgi:hypothetical protein
MEVDDGDGTKPLVVKLTRPEAEDDAERTESDDEEAKPKAVNDLVAAAAPSPKSKKAVSDLIAANAAKKGFVASTVKVLGSSIAGLAVDDKVAAAIAGIRRLSGLQVRPRRSPRGALSETRATHRPPHSLLRPRSARALLQRKVFVRECRKSNLLDGIGVDPNAQKVFICPDCEHPYGSSGGLAAHRSKGCDGGKWRCGWCKCKSNQTTGKSPGPKGPATLCSVCASRFRSGHKGPPKKNAAGEFICDKCKTTFKTMRGLGSHRRGCTGGKWRCGWCKCQESRSRGKSPGPTGAATLCSACGSRYRSGHTGPPRKDHTGFYVCDDCNKRYRSIGALGGHRRFCISLSRMGGQLFDDMRLPPWVAGTAKSGRALVALPARTGFRSKAGEGGIPRELIGPALEAWDFLAVCSASIFDQVSISLVCSFCLLLLISCFVCIGLS